MNQDQVDDTIEKIKEKLIEKDPTGLAEVPIEIADMVVVKPVVETFRIIKSIFNPFDW